MMIRNIMMIQKPTTRPQEYEMTTIRLDQNTTVTRQPNGDWYNNSTETVFTAGTLTAKFYDRLAIEQRHEAARLAVWMCHMRNMREIARIAAEREWVEVMTTPLFEEIPF